MSQPRSEPEPVLHGRSLRRSFGNLRAVDGVSVSVGAGQVAGLIGANGAGKSTLLNLLSGVTKADGGTVELTGRDVSNAAAAVRARRGLLRTFQHPRLVRQLTVLENVMIGAHTRAARPRDVWAFVLQRRREKRLAATAAHALDEVGVAEQTWRKRVADIPATEHRWVEIARAVAAGPVALLLDEPNSGFTRGETARLTELLADLAAVRQVGILLVTHDVSLAMRACSRLTVMHHGAELAAGPPAEIVNSDKVVTAYLGERKAHLAREILDRRVST